MGAIAYKGEVYPNGSATAKDSVFDNTDTDLESTNAEDAIKEVDGKVEELSSNIFSIWTTVLEMTIAPSSKTAAISFAFPSQLGTRICAIGQVEGVGTGVWDDMYTIKIDGSYCYLTTPNTAGVTINVRVIVFYKPA